MKEDPKDRALENCIQLVQAGASSEDALKMYPQWAEELRPRLEAVEGMRWLGTGTIVPEGARERSRAEMLRAAQRARRQPTRSPWFSGWRRSLVTLALLLVLVAGGLRTVTAAARSLPGDTLYPLKIASENTRLLFVTSDEQRMELKRSFDQERVEEVEALIERHGSEPQEQAREVEFAGPVLDVAGNRWKVGDVWVTVPEDTRLVGRIEAGYYVEVEGVIEPDGTMIARQIQAREYELNGKLQRVEAGLWVVDGVEVEINAHTVLPGEVAPGDRVKVSVIPLANGRLLARRAILVSSSGTDLSSDRPTTPSGTEQHQVSPLQKTKTMDEQRLETPASKEEDPQHIRTPGGGEKVDEQEPAHTPEPGTEDEPENGAPQEDGEDSPGSEEGGGSAEGEHEQEPGPQGTEKPENEDGDSAPHSGD